MWIAVVVVTRVWGTWLAARGHRLHLGAIPVAGTWAWRPGLLATPAVVAAIAVYRIGRSPRRHVLVTAGAVAIAWVTALTLVDGAGGFTKGIESRYEYLPFARSVVDLPTFVSTFTDEAAGYPTHVKSHPPGMVVLYASLAKVGMASAGVAAALSIAGGAVAVMASLRLLRVLGGAALAERAAPFVAASPLALWIASSGDAVYAGVTLAGAAAIVSACARRRDALALSGGVLLGVAAHLSYGIVLVAPVLVAAAWRRRALRPVAIASAGALAVAATFFAAGFAWWEGLHVARVAYAAGVAPQRPFWYFAIGNLGALALATGPVVAVGIAAAWRDRSSSLWLLAPVAAAIAIADLSGMSKGEVERIWIFLAVPLTAAATADLPHRRIWLGLHLAYGAALAIALRTPW